MYLAPVLVAYKLRVCPISILRSVPLVKNLGSTSTPMLARIPSWLILSPGRYWFCLSLLCSLSIIPIPTQYTGRFRSLFCSICFFANVTENHRNYNNPYWRRSFFLLYRPPQLWPSSWSSSWLPPWFLYWFYFKETSNGFALSYPLVPVFNLQSHSSQKGARFFVEDPTALQSACRYSQHIVQVLYSFLVLGWWQTICP